MSRHGTNRERERSPARSRRDDRDRDYQGSNEPRRDDRRDDRRDFRPASAPANLSLTPAGGQPFLINASAATPGQTMASVFEVIARLEVKVTALEFALTRCVALSQAAVQNAAAANTAFSIATTSLGRSSASTGSAFVATGPPGPADGEADWLPCKAPDCGNTRPDNNDYCRRCRNKWLTSQGQRVPQTPT